MRLLRKPLATLATCALMSVLAPSARSAELGGFDLAGSGFLTLTAGKMLGGTKGEASGYKKPFFVADYGQAGVYEGGSGVQWKPDSKLGLQGTATFPDRCLSVTGQVVSRGARDGRVNLEWLYGSYKLSDDFTIQAGRKRLPMFYYSDIQDVGFALPWTHLPPQLYGWEAINYTGINLAYRGQWGSWSGMMNVLAGSEAKKESAYWKIYRGKDNRTDIRWDDILGGDITLSRGWLETRLVYIQSKMQEKNVSGTWDGAGTPGANTYGQTAGTAPQAGYPSPAGSQRIFGIAVNADYNNFLLRSEFIYIDHKKSMGYKDFAQILGIGYRLGRFTPMVTVSNYRAQAILSAGANPDGQEAHRTTSLTLRYDLDTTSALKMQYDSQKDRSGPDYTLDGSGRVPSNRFGDARLLTVAYDLVF